jgi:hypothetical protein
MVGGEERDRTVIVSGWVGLRARRMSAVSLRGHRYADQSPASQPSSDASYIGTVKRFVTYDTILR